MDSRPRRLARFGVFEADFEIGELRRQGRVVPLQEQPLLVLAVLLEQPDQPVSRDQLRQRLWPDQAFLDFETGINTAVAKLRQALGDSAENPRFIATRPRHGYRFIAPVRWVSRWDDSQEYSASDAESPAPDPAASASAAVGARLSAHSWLKSGTGLLILIVSLTLGTPWIRQVISQADSTHRRASAEPAALEIRPPADELLTGSFAISPDGTSMAFVTGDATPARSRLWLRSLDAVTARALPETEGAAMPFWSPDGSVIGFFAKGKLKTLDLVSGTVSSIADAPRGRGGCWSKDGLILFAPDVNSPVFSVGASGGRAVPVTELGNAPSHRFPIFLPDGRHFLFLVLREDRDQSEIWWGQVGGATGGRLLTATSDALYMEPGYLFFARGPELFAQAFDAAGLRVIGQPLLVSERVGVYGEEGPTGLAAFSVSAAGSLAVADRVRPAQRLLWFDRDGNEIGAVAPPGEYMSLDLSADASRVAVSRFDPRKRSSDLLSLDLQSGVVTQVTDDPWPDSAPVWDPRGDRLAFGSLRDGRWRIFVRDVRRGREQQLSSEPYVYSWFPDGRSLVVGRLSQNTGINLWRLPVEPGAEATPLLIGPGNQTDGQVSPDGRWLAYTSDEEGQREIYLRDLRAQSSRRISSGGGDISRWRRDRRELFYLSGKTLMSVSVRSGPPLQVGPPQRLFEPPLPANDSLGELGAAAAFGVASDGSRFLFPSPIKGELHSAIRVVRHWSPAPPR